jgi:ribosomal protein S18 acetylase RimI-like enzyme
MKIRPFRADDTEAVVSLWQRCALTVPWNDPYKDIERKALVQPELFLIGTIDGLVVATAMGGYDGHRGWIYYLGVDPQLRGNGFGSMIVEELESRIRALGCPKINLLVRATNTEVIKFYSRLGYRTDDVAALGKRIVPD